MSIPLFLPAYLLTVRIIDSFLTQVGYNTATSSIVLITPTIKMQYTMTDAETLRNGIYCISIHAEAYTTKSIISLTCQSPMGAVCVALQLQPSKVPRTAAGGGGAFDGIAHKKR